MRSCYAGAESRSLICINALAFERYPLKPLSSSKVRISRSLMRWTHKQKRRSSLLRDLLSPEDTRLRGE